VIRSAAAKSGAACQAKVLKPTQKLFDTGGKLILKCEDLGLAGKSALFVSATQMQE